MFAAVFGAGMLAAEYPLVVDAWRLARDARTWAETRCTIDHLAKVRARGAVIGLTGGFHFDFRGARYVGSRLAVSSRLARPAALAALHARLDAARARHEPVPCYVDPADPRRSVIDRDLRATDFLGAAVFFGLGFSFLSLGAHVVSEGLRRRRGQRSRAPALASERPWEREPEWVAQRCLPKVPAPRFALIFKVLLVPTAVAVPFVFFATSQRWQAAASVALAVVFGIDVPWRVYHALIRRRLAGDVLLLLSAPVFQPGDTVRAELSLPARHLTGRELVARLVCSREVSSGGRFLHRLGRVDLGEVERRVPLEEWARRSSHAARVPLEITVPADLPGTGRDRDSGLETYWQLEATVDDAPGLGFATVFDVPVFSTEGG